MGWFRTRFPGKRTSSPQSRPSSLLAAARVVRIGGSAPPRRLAIGPGDPFDLDERPLLEKRAHLEERHRRIVTAEVLAEHFAEGFQLRDVVVAAPHEHV